MAAVCTHIVDVIYAHIGHVMCVHIHEVASKCLNTVAVICVFRNIGIVHWMYCYMWALLNHAILSTLVHE